MHYVIYYGGMFSWQYIHYYTAAPYDMPQIQKMIMAAYQAALDIASLIVVSAVINQGCQLAGWLSQKFQHYGWDRIGQFFHWISSYGHYGSYAYQSYNQGLFSTGVSVRVGELTEKLIEKTGKYLVDRYFDSRFGFFNRKNEKSQQENDLVLKLD